MYNVETVQQNLKAIATAHADFAKTSFEQGKTYVAQLKRIPVILKHSLRERNSWRIRLGLVVG